MLNKAELSPVLKLYELSRQIKCLATPLRDPEPLKEIVEQLIEVVKNMEMRSR